VEAQPKELTNGTHPPDEQTIKYLMYPVNHISESKGTNRDVIDIMAPINGKTMTTLWLTN